MTEPLRPATLGEILDRTAQLYRTRFLLFLGISILPVGIELVLACVIVLPIAWWSAMGARSVSIEAGYALVTLFCIFAALVAVPVFLAATALATAAMNQAAALVHMGETTTIRNAYRSVWRRGWSYVGLYLLKALIVFVAPFVVWFVLLMFAAGGAAAAKAEGWRGGVAGGVLLGLGAVLVIVALIGYCIWMGLKLSLVFPVSVVEQTGAVAALKRSSLLSRGTKGRIFVLYLLGAVLGWLLSMGCMVPLMILIALIPGMSNAAHAQALTQAMVFVFYGASFAVQALVKPVYGIALLLFYYDQRIRQEGYDIELMMQKAGMVTAPPPQPETVPWLPAAPRKTEAEEAPATATAASGSEVTTEAPQPEPLAEPASGAFGDPA